MIKFYVRVAFVSVVFAHVFTCIAAAGSVSILNVDFNDGGSPTTSATDGNGVGFQSLDVTTDGLTKTFTGLDSGLTSGSVVVNLSNPYAGNGRDRGAGFFSGEFRDLYRDFAAFNWQENGFVTALTLSGLKPLQDYQFSFQSWDYLFEPGIGITSLKDLTPGGATNGKITNAYFHVGAHPVDPSFSITDFSSPYGASATFSVTSNASGVLVFGIGDPIGVPGRYTTEINAFELSYGLPGSSLAVPEPSIFLSVISGLLPLLAFYGRRVVLLHSSTPLPR